MRTSPLLALPLLVAFLAPIQTMAQNRTEAIQLLVGFSAGGGLDTSARIIAKGMSDVLNQPVLVINKPGAGGLLAAQALKAAPADGHTVWLANDHSVAILPHTVPSNTYSADRDLRPIALVNRSALALGASVVSGVHDLGSLREYLKVHPGVVNIGVPAAASLPEVIAYEIGSQLQTQTQAIPYKGGGPMLTDLLAGQIPLGVSGAVEISRLDRAKKINVVAVTGTRRHPALPDTPTFEELGLAGLDITNVIGMYARAGVPEAEADRLTAALKQTLEDPETQKLLAETGTYAKYGPPEALAEAMGEVSNHWAPRVLKLAK